MKDRGGGVCSIKFSFKERGAMHHEYLCLLQESMHDVMKKMEDDSDEKIEEMIDDISTNDMFGSSILSM